MAMVLERMASTKVSGLLKLKLPIPPTINHYYFRTKRGMIIGKRGKEFRRITQEEMQIFYPRHEEITGPVSVKVFFTPPDRRRRDLDNLGKCLWDSLEKAGVYKDDSQIMEIYMLKKAPEKPGYIEVEVHYETT